MADRGFDVGDRIGRYVVRAELGRGGMGRVLRAHDPKLNREVGLKDVHRNELGSVGARRLVAEARAMAKLSHPNVVPIYDVVELEGDRVVLVMEYVDGQSLTQWLQEPRAWADVVAQFVQAGRGLAAAHAAGVLHRDFKPDNVLVGRDGRVRVTDFGLAREIVPPATDELDPGTLPPTAPGAIVGTLGYLAPERLFGAPADPTTDQFAFCVALWEALFGERPFKGRTVVELAMSMTAGPPIPRAAAEVPAEVIETVKRGLANKATERWPDMEAVLAALARASAPRVEPPSRRQRAVWMVAGGIGLGLFAVLAYALATVEDPSSRPELAPPPRSEAPRPEPRAEAEPAPSDVAVDTASLEQIELRAAASPREATLFVDGEPLDGNPAVVALPRGDTLHRIEARADGHETRTTEIVAEKDQAIVLELPLLEPHRRGTRAPRRRDKLPIDREPPWEH